MRELFFSGLVFSMVTLLKKLSKTGRQAGLCNEVVFGTTDWHIKLLDPHLHADALGSGNLNCRFFDLMSSVTYAAAASFWVVSLCAAAIQDQELFLQANNVYKKMAYQQAVQLYDQIEDKGYAVWVNLGNCAYHLQDYPQAYVCWLRAQKKAPFSLQSTIENNYNLLTGDHDQQRVLQSWQDQIAVRMSPLLVQLCAALFWILFWVFIITGRWKKWALLCATSGICACVCGILTFICYKSGTSQYAVTAKKVMVYSGPNEQYHAIGELHQLCKVCVQETDAPWCKIRCGNTVGWVLTSAIIEV